MTVDEIKERYSMQEIAGRYGLHPNRAGFVSCPFHQGDHTPSMKIYPHDYHCHACGANGDIFSFIQQMDHCDFKAAFYSLGGTYGKPTDSSRLALYRHKKARERRLRKEAALRQKIKHNNMLLTMYADWLKHLEPLSDAWCDCMNERMKCIGRDEYLQKELEGGEE